VVDREDTGMRGGKIMNAELGKQVEDCTHGGDCLVHPRSAGLHNYDPERGHDVTSRQFFGRYTGNGRCSLYCRRCDTWEAGVDLAKSTDHAATHAWWWHRRAGREVAL
jgi:hypothetical protein